MGNKAETRIGIRWVYLAVGTVVLLFAGIVYAWSIIKAPFARDFAWNAGQLGLNYTITIMAFCIGGFVSGLFSKKTSYMLRMLVAGLLVLAGFIITSQISGKSVFTLFISYGILSGFGIGVVYNALVSLVIAWFPDKKGLASGVILTGFALNSLTIGNIANNYLGVDTWRTTYLVLGIVTAAVVIAAAFLLKMPSASTVLPADKVKVRKTQDIIETKDYSIGQVLSRVSFWLLFVFFMLLSSVGSAAISFAKDILKDTQATDVFAVAFVGIASIFNAVGRFSSGALFDGLGIRKTQFITSAIAILGPLAVFLAFRTHSLALGVIGLCLCYVSYGFSPTGTTAFSRALFGPKNFALNLSILNLHLIIAPFAATLAGKIKVLTGSFETTFLILAGLSVIGLVVNIFIKKK
ncbi:MAG: OFA family MFS transporter [Clostridiales bacterium]|nr:OFA family MFS transporter [Clostridiales bacterium]